MRYLNAVTGPSDFARIKIYRATVSRASTNAEPIDQVEAGCKFLNSAINIMKCHGVSKSKLEFQFENEPGTGLGPTIEFYNLCAGFLRFKKLGIWINREGDTDVYHTENLYPLPNRNL